MSKTPEIPAVPFPMVQHRIAAMWNPAERNPHHVIFGPTGSGKSYLIRHGILPTCAGNRTLIIDVKGRDSVWAGCGEVVPELPARTRAQTYRLDTTQHSNPKELLRETFERVRNDGHWILVIDEMRSITETQRLALGSIVENLILEGRGLGISCIMGAQSTAYAVPSFKDQGGFMWFGRTRNHVQADKLSKFAGYGTELIPTIKSIPPRSWLYLDAFEDEPLPGITSVPAAS